MHPRLAPTSTGQQPPPAILVTIRDSVTVSMLGDCSAQRGRGVHRAAGCPGPQELVESWLRSCQRDGLG